MKNQLPNKADLFRYWESSPRCRKHFLQLMIANAIFTIPTHGPKNNFALKMPTMEGIHMLNFSLKDDLAYHLWLFATVPAWVSMAKMACFPSFTQSAV